MQRNNICTGMRLVRKQSKQDIRTRTFCRNPRVKKGVSTLDNTFQVETYGIEIYIREVLDKNYCEACRKH